MSGKNKVTLYIPSDLHRKLKIKAAVESEAMSVIAERAIIFYLDNPHVVDEVEAVQGNANRVYSCPECEADILFRNGEVESLEEQPGIIQAKDDDLSLSGSGDDIEPSDIERVIVGIDTEHHGHESLVTC